MDHMATRKLCHRLKRAQRPLDNDNRGREFRQLRFSGESVSSGGSRTVSLPGGDGPPARFPAAGQRASGGWDLREGQLLLTRRLGWEEPERGEVDGPPVIPGAELPQPESGVARRVQNGGGGGGGDGDSSQDGGKTADPDGQREAQQKHHAARQRGQDLGRGPSQPCLAPASRGRVCSLPFPQQPAALGGPVPPSLLPGR